MGLAAIFLWTLAALYSIESTGKYNSENLNVLFLNNLRYKSNFRRLFVEPQIRGCASFWVLIVQ